MAACQFLTKTSYTAQCVGTVSLAGGRFEINVDFWPWNFYGNTVSPLNVSIFFFFSRAKGD